MALLGETAPRVAVVGAGNGDAHAAGYLLSAGEPDLRVDVLHTPLHIPRSELLARYDAIMYATGQTGDPSPPLPGSDLFGATTAPAVLDQVGVDGASFSADGFDLSCRRAVVIGDNDAGLAVARRLLSTVSPPTDTSGPARNAIEEVVVLGRAGPEQSAVTRRALEALDRLAAADVVADQREVAVPAAYREPSPDAELRHRLAVLHQYANRPRRPGCRRIALRFLLSPTRILGVGRVQAVELVRNTLERDAEGRLRDRATASRATIPAGLVVAADHARHAPVPGVPLESTDEDGRVLGADGRPTGEYVSDTASPFPTVRALLHDLVTGL